MDRFLLLVRRMTTFERWAPQRLLLAVVLFLTTLFGAKTALADDAPDTVFLVDGGRIRGSVMVEDEREVRVELKDGSTKFLKRSEVQRIQFGPVTASKPTDESDDDSVKPRRKSHRDTDEEPARPATQMRSSDMVIAGGVMTGVGFAALLVGLVTLPILSSQHATDAGPMGGVTALIAGGATVGITGAVLIGVGRQRVPVNETPTQAAVSARPAPGGFVLAF